MGGGEGVLIPIFLIAIVLTRIDHVSCLSAVDMFATYYKFTAIEITIPG